MYQFKDISQGSFLTLCFLLISARVAKLSKQTYGKKKKNTKRLSYLGILFLRTISYSLFFKPAENEHIVFKGFGLGISSDLLVAPWTVCRDSESCLK